MYQSVHGQIITMRLLLYIFLESKV